MTIHQSISENGDDYGSETISHEMIIATLTHNVSNASATLNEQMLLRIVECQKEDVLLYQLSEDFAEYTQHIVEAS